MAAKSNLLVVSTLAFSTIIGTIVQVRADDLVFHGWEPPAAYTGDVGLRFWYGRGKTGKDLFNPSGTALVSRLTYNNLALFSAEAYARFDLNTGWFVKGFVGGGGFRNGTLTDEDFPPGITPYSATLSVLDNSYPFYATVDAGYNILRGPDFRVGAFVGYHYLQEVVSAQGCGQIATNPLICGIVPVPDSIKVITQDNNWNAVRLGLDGAFDVTDRLRLSVDAAWLPFVWLNGTDSHWLRIGTDIGDFAGPIPEDGTGWGYQLEGIVSYRVTDFLSVGVGGRYWHMETKGLSHFEGNVVGVAAAPQPVNWSNDNYGVFVQTSLNFGPYPTISSN